MYNVIFTDYNVYLRAIFGLYSPQKICHNLFIMPKILQLTYLYNEPKCHKNKFKFESWIYSIFQFSLCGKEGYMT